MEPARLLIKWRCHDALLSLSSSITSTEEASPATVTVNPTAMASRYRSLIIASLLIARFALRYIETSVWRCYYVRKLAFCMHVSLLSMLDTAHEHPFRHRTYTDGIDHCRATRAGHTSADN